MRWLQVVIILIIFIGVGWFFFGNAHKVVVENNFKKEPLPIILGKYQDVHCGMPIDSLEYAAQVVLNEGKTYFFMDLGGVVLWLKDKNLDADNVTIWFYTRDAKEWAKAQEVRFKRENTPMHYNFGAYKNLHNGIDFKTFWELMYHSSQQKHH